ncbi:MAG: hypothetical protein P8N61_10515 [Porticoccaceae bacterium]|jgi:hypothetical protein|nr:hypothetical protein [Porticoccaceae bacterium]
MKDKIVNFTYITSIIMLLALVLSVLLAVASTGLAVPLESIAALGLSEFEKLADIFSS